jgi:tetratricopeptide (TPR) repeat protein
MNVLTDAISRGWAAADRDDPEPTITYFRDLLGQHPADPRALFAYAGALDYAGQEEAAVGYYEQAFAAGLAGDERRHALIPYGSTLRNLGRHADAVSVLRDAHRQYPADDAATVFLALALASAGRSDEAVSTLITLALDRIDSDDLRRYRWPLRQYAQALGE